MTRARRELSYDDTVAAHASAVGAGGVRKLRNAHVAIVGVGGVGAAVCHVLVGLGVGRITLIDPQRLEADNFNRFPVAKRRNLGQSKVHYLKHLYGARPGVVLRSVQATVSASRGRSAVGAADLVVCAANTMRSRLDVATAAKTAGIACVGVGVSDAGRRRSGVVTIWQPKREWACQACFIAGPLMTDAVTGSILPTVANMVAAVGAEVVLRLLCSQSMPGSFFDIDLDNLSIEVMTVLRRADCGVCSR